METQNTQELIAQRMQELPEDVRAAIQSAELDTTLQKIGGAHGLHIDQIATLIDETILVMLGFEPMDTFSARLAESFKISSDEAGKLSQDINAQVFLAIRESLKQFAAAKQTAPAVVPTAPAPATAPTFVALAPTAPAVAATPTKPMPEELMPAEHLLKNTTVSVPTATPTDATAAPATPPAYTQDPYHEPID
jgi:hypothetical protein